MPSSYPSIASVLSPLTTKGYKVEIYRQKSGKFVVAASKGDFRYGVSFTSCTSRLILAALLKITRKLEAN